MGVSSAAFARERPTRRRSRRAVARVRERDVVHLRAEVFGAARRRVALGTEARDALVARSASESGASARPRVPSVVAAAGVRVRVRVGVRARIRATRGATGAEGANSRRLLRRARERKRAAGSASPSGPLAFEHAGEHPRARDDRAPVAAVPCAAAAEVAASRRASRSPRGEWRTTRTRASARRARSKAAMTAPSVSSTEGARYSQQPSSPSLRRRGPASPTFRCRDWAETRRGARGAGRPRAGWHKRVRLRRPPTSAPERHGVQEREGRSAACLAPSEPPAASAPSSQERCPSEMSSVTHRRRGRSRPQPGIAAERAQSAAASVSLRGAHPKRRSATDAAPPPTPS